MKEWELVYKCKDYLKNKYIDYYLEFPFYYLRVDFVGIDIAGDITFIEFKVRDWKKVIQQAYKHMAFCNYNYICMPSGIGIQRLKKARLKELNIGLIEVNKVKAQEIIKPKRGKDNSFTVNYMREKIKIINEKYPQWKIDFDGIQEFHEREYIKSGGQPSEEEICRY